MCKKASTSESGQTEATLEPVEPSKAGNVETPDQSPAVSEKNIDNTTTPEAGGIKLELAELSKRSNTKSQNVVVDITDSDDVTIVERNLRKECAIDINGIARKIERTFDVKVTMQVDRFEIRGPPDKRVEAESRLRTELEREHMIQRFKSKTVSLPQSIYSLWFLNTCAHPHSSLGVFATSLMPVLLMMANSFLQIVSTYWISADARSNTECLRPWITQNWPVYTFSVFIFVSVALDDVFETCKLMLYIHFLPSMVRIGPPIKGVITIEECDSLEMARRKPGDKFSLYLMVILPKLAICIYLMASGVQFLVSDREKPSTLLVNALTLHFIMEIDEILFKVFIPDHIQEAVSNIPPMCVDKATELPFWQCFCWFPVCFPYPTVTRCAYRMAFGMWWKAFLVAVTCVWVTFYFAIGNCTAGSNAIEAV
eukprot:252123_1